MPASCGLKGAGSVGERVDSWDAGTCVVEGIGVLLTDGVTGFGVRVGKGDGVTGVLVCRAADAVLVANRSNLS